MHLSIIIPTYNRAADLAKCLDRLAPGAQTLSVTSYEVIVSDDSTNDDSMLLIHSKYSWVRWVRGCRKGPAANRNNGAKNARGAWLIFTDDDCLPDAGWLEAYSNAIDSDKNHNVFEGRTYPDRPRPTLDSISPVNETGGYLWSCNFAIKHSLFNDMQGFDERFPYAAMEDVELALRLKKEKHNFRFVSAASICHPWRRVIGIRAYKQHELSTLLFLRIHPDESRRINARFYLYKTLRLMIFDTLPGLISCRGRGSFQALLMHLYGFKTAFKLLVRI